MFAVNPREDPLCRCLTQHNFQSDIFGDFEVCLLGTLLLVFIAHRKDLEQFSCCL